MALAREGLEQMEIQEQLRPILTPRLCLRVCTACFQKARALCISGARRNSMVVEACLEQVKAAGATGRE